METHPLLSKPWRKSISWVQFLKKLSHFHINVLFSHFCSWMTHVCSQKYQDPQRNNNMYLVSFRCQPFQLANWARLILCCFKLAKNGNLSSISNEFPKEIFLFWKIQKFTMIFIFFGVWKAQTFGDLKNKKEG
jgi:hypothetical protein